MNGAGSEQGPLFLYSSPPVLQTLLPEMKIFMDSSAFFGQVSLNERRNYQVVGQGAEGVSKGS